MAFSALPQAFVAALLIISVFARPASAQRLSPDYGKIPLSFETNQGQTDPRVKFLSRGDGYGLFLTPTEAVLSLLRPSSINGSIERASLRMTLVGANARPIVRPEGELPGKTNYLASSDRSKWLTNVANYSRVRYEAVYPGVDLLYYGNQRQLEFDFVVSPGANPRSIQMRFDGADSMRLDAKGDLILALGNEHLVQHRPIAYQEIDGRRREIPSTYVIKGNRQVGVSVANYDRTRPLIIDPVISYATYLGSYRIPRALAVDAAGNAYVAADTVSADFPAHLAGFLYTMSVASITPAEASVLVTKYNPSGTAVLYSTFFGESPVSARDIAVDAAGQVYFVGNVYYLPPDRGAVPVVNGFLTNTTFDFSAGFFAKLDSAGALLYSTYLQGGSASRVAVDGSGNAYVTGFGGVSPSAGAFRTSGDAHLLKINTNASGAASVSFATYLGSFVNYWENRPNVPRSELHVALDPSGNVYIAGTVGNFDGEDTTLGFPTTPGAFDSSYNSGLEGYVDFFGDIGVLKLNPTGTAALYFTFVGGLSGESASGLAVDSSGNAFVTGVTSYHPDLRDHDFPTFPTTPGAFQTDAGHIAPVVFKLNPAGSALVYSTFLSGGRYDRPAGIAIDGQGRATVALSSESPGFPVTADALDTTNEWTEFGPRDIAVARLSSAGSTLEYSTFYGRETAEAAIDMATDASGNLFVLGAVLGFPNHVPPAATPGAYDTTPNVSIVPPVPPNPDDPEDPGYDPLDYLEDAILFRLGAPLPAAPVVDAANAAVVVEEGQLATNSGTFNDANGDDVTISASVGTVTAASGTWSWSLPAADGPASSTVTITADDGEGGSTTTTFSLTVNNVAPTANAGSNQTAAARQAFTLNGTWSDPALAADGPYAWSWTPVTAAVNAAGQSLTATSGSSAYGATIPFTANIAVPGTYQFDFSVTDKDGASHLSTVTVTVKQQFVAFGTNSVEVKSNAIVTGDIGAPAAATGKTLTDKGVEVAIGVNASLTAGSAIYADSLIVRSNSSVPLAFFNQLVDRGPGNVTTEVSPLPAGITTPQFAGSSGITGTQTIWLDGSQGDCNKPNTTCLASGATLAPGSYANLRSRSGANNHPNVLYLLPGDYAFESIDLGQRTELRAIGAAGTVRVFVASQMDTDANSYIGPAAGSGLTAHDIVFHVGGINGRNGTIGSHPKSAQIGVRNTIVANIYAPMGTIVMQEGTAATGAFVARDVEVGVRVTLTLDSAFQ